MDPRKEADPRKECTPPTMGLGKGALFAACAEELGSQPPQGPLVSPAPDRLLLLVQWAGCSSLPGGLCSQGSTAQGSSLTGSGALATQRVGGAWKEAPPTPTLSPSGRHRVEVIPAAGRVTHTLFCISVGLPGQRHTLVLPLRVEPYARLISSKFETLIKEWHFLCGRRVPEASALPPGTVFQLKLCPEPPGPELTMLVNP